MTHRQLWADVDRWFEAYLLPPDAALDNALKRSHDAGLPAIHVAPNQGKLIHLFAKMCRAKRVLEVGTLGGYSTIWLGRALPPEGRLITLEIDPRHADVARQNVADAHLSDRVEVRLGPAVESMEQMIASGEPPFDFVFIDADKPSNAAYLERALALTQPGSVIVIDNVVRQGKVIDPASNDPNVHGVQRLMVALQNEPRLSATHLQTVGGKNYDGFILATVLD